MKRVSFKLVAMIRLQKFVTSLRSRFTLLVLLACVLQIYISCSTKEKKPSPCTFCDSNHIVAVVAQETSISSTGTPPEDFGEPCIFGVDFDMHLIAPASISEEDKFGQWTSYHYRIERVGEVTQLVKPTFWGSSPWPEWLEGWLNRDGGAELPLNQKFGCQKGGPITENNYGFTTSKSEEVVYEVTFSTSEGKNTYNVAIPRAERNGKYLYLIYILKSDGEWEFRSYSVERAVLNSW